MKAILEKFNRPIDTTLRTVHYKQKQFSVPYHFHDLCELTIIEKGKGKLIVSDMLYNFYPRHISLIASDISHTYVSSADTNLTEWYLLQFSPDILKNIPDFSSVLNLIKNESAGYMFNEKDFNSIKKYFFKIHKAKSIDKFIAFLELLKILIKSKKTHLAMKSEDPNNKDLRIAKIEQYIHQNSERNISLKEIAKHACMSQGGVSRLFSGSKGVSIIAYIKNVRIANACKLISETNDSITQIAFAVGYENLSNFNRQFKEIVGMTPILYRKNIKNLAKI